jgi:dipeptidyl aminopeptidase/acylaminoacyl peptidase
MLKAIFKPGVLIWIAVGLIAVFVAVYIGVGIYGASTFNKSPNRPADYGENTPAKYGLAYENVSFQTASEPKLILKGWWIANPSSDQALVIVHGHNANRTRHLEVSKPLWDKGFNLLYFDLQGQGSSEGERYYFGQHEQYDVIAAFNFVKSKGFSPEKIGVLAYSMGGSSALLALSHTPEIKVVVSDSAYASFEKVAEYRFTHDKGYPPKYFLPGIIVAGNILYGFDINQTKPELTLPAVTGRRILLIHGTADKDVPVEHLYMLQKAAGNNIVDSWIVPNAAHVQSFDLYPDEYIQRVSSFFKQELACSPLLL